MKNTAHYQKIVYSACLILPLAGVCIDIYTPGLPEMARYFSTAPRYVQGTITAYLVSYGIGQLFFGPLSDCWGRKRVMLGGISLFLPATAGMLVVSSLPAFIGFRVLQGIAMAAIAAPCRALLPDICHGAILKKAAGSLALAFSLGPVFAPVIGGCLTQNFGWRAPLWVLWMYGCAVLIVVLALPETHPIEKRSPLTVRALRIQYGMLLNSAPFCALALTITLLYSVPVMFLVAGPFLVQIALHQSAAAYGHFGFLLGCAWCAGNVLNRATLHRNTRLKMLILLSVLVFLAALSSLWFYLRPLSLNSLKICLTMLVLISGTLFPAGFSFCLGLFPNTAGTASALIGAITITGTGFMSAVASHLNTSSAAPLMTIYFLIFMTGLGISALCLPRKA